MKVTLRRPSPALLVALLALFVAADGPAHAARLIDGKLIKRNTIRGKQVKDRSLSARDLSSAAVRKLRTPRPNSITAAQLRAGSVTAAHITANAVNGERIAPSSVTALTVADQSLTSADLAPNSVTGEEIAPDAIGRGHIKQGGVAKSEIQRNAVGADEVIDGGLQARDVASFAGAVTVAFPEIAAGGCATVTHDVAPTGGATHDLTGDLVLASAPAGWPEELTLLARAAGPGTIAFSACNVGSELEPAAASVQTVAFAALDL